MVQSKYSWGVITLQDGDQLPAQIEWEGNLPVAGSKMILLQTGKPVRWLCDGGKVKVYLPKSVVQKNETVALSFIKR